MLTDLAIENLALFERARLEFGPGLNVITGETGAGKSLLVDALELVLGERPRASVVRTGSEEARAEGRFVLAAEIARAPQIESFLADSLPAVVDEWRTLAGGDERELVLTRAIAESGRSRAWVNHRPVTLRVLKELAGLLVEIHGQNEHQRLLDTGEQTRLLDAFGACENTLAKYESARSAWITAAEEAAGFERRAQEKAERLDLLRFQARELADARADLEAHAELMAERDRLRWAEDLSRELGTAAAELAGEDGAALAAVRHARRVVAAWETRVAELRAHGEELDAALVHLEEASSGLERFLSRVEANPKRLEDVEERLYSCEILQKKHRVDVNGLLARADAIAREIRELETSGETFEALTVHVAELRHDVVAAAALLTKKRKSTATKLAVEVQKTLAELGLEKARFSVRLTARELASPSSPNATGAALELLTDQRRFAHDGADELEFLLAANPGEPSQPLRHVASGGEAARIMLALRTALAVQQTIPTLVFDEVDAGVGGRLGPRVGEHLRALASRHQILCVTHLPAIAALAHHHFKVAKHTSGARTRTDIAALSGDARIEEVADMIAGGAAHATARAEARRLLGLGS